MTGKELFEKHAGDTIRIGATLGPDWNHSVPYRICGYGTELFFDCVVLENRDAWLGTENITKVILMPDLPPDWRGALMNVGNLDLNSIVLQNRSSSNNLCCRCGKRYANKREHRSTCNP